MSVIVTNLVYTTVALLIGCAASAIAMIVFTIQSRSIPKKIRTNDKVTLNKANALKKNNKIANWVFGGCAVGIVILMVAIYFVNKNEKKTA
jgi:high-affinity Fe2+/Pb2+ permease